MNPRHGIMVLERQRVRLIDRLMNTDPKLAQGLASVCLPWFTIRNAADDDDTTEVMIYEEIGFWGITADEFVSELNKIKSKRINLRINSPGGGVFDAIAIYNALVGHSATVRTQVDALAASAASVIAMAGDEVVMMVGAQLMIHDAIGLAWGNAREMRDMAKFLDQQSDNIASIYAERGKGTPEEFRSMMLAETWLFGEEAVQLGLADEVYSRASKEDAEPSKPETDPETEPDSETEDTPEPEVSEKDGEETADSDESIDDLVEKLMSIPHRTDNRGFKFANRKQAGKPKLADDAWLDALIDAMPAGRNR